MRDERKYRRLRVGYLGGLGRSGTTLLARLLGALPDVCDVGEICHLWERGVVAGQRCGCGAGFHDCPFWQRVGDTAFGGWSTVDVERVRYLRTQVDRVRHVPKVMTGLSWPTRRLLADYLELHERLYRAIRDVTGCRVILDSSKHGSFAFCLQRSRLLDLRVVHCVRDSRAVAFSWRRNVVRPEVTGGRELMPIYSPGRSAALWTMENALFETLALSRVPVRRVRYEDLASNPSATVEELAWFLDITPPTTELVADGTAHLAASHSVAGNPMRFTAGPVRVRADDAWRSESTGRQARVVSALTLPLRVRYGYG